jgi:HD superfamily phosphohydrolase
MSTLSINIIDPLWAPDGYLIASKILIQLLKSTPIQRLKHISQNGAANYFSEGNKKVSKITRYDHSVGCMILTLIVALLHDVMHTAFSHTIDFLTNDPSQSFHEIHKKTILENFSKDFENILGTKWRKYFDESNYPFVKKNKPFAIDIADYTARDGLYNDLCTTQEISKFKHLLAKNVMGHLSCTTFEASIWWNTLSKKVNDTLYNSPWSIAINFNFAFAIKSLIDSKQITLEYLSSTDIYAEKNVFALIQNLISKQMEGKLWFLLQPLTYDINKYIFQRSIKMRYRYVSPPIGLEYKHETEVNSSFDMDLVYLLYN